MARAHAGVKRSYRDMNGASPSPIATPSGLRSVVSPVGTAASIPEAGSSVGDVRQTTSSPGPVPTAREALFDPAASIILIGVRGVGKRTLSVLTATAFARRLRDTERAFQEAVGTQSSTYRQARNHQDYQDKRNEVLRNLLKDNDKGAVIIAAFADLEGKGIDIIRHFSRTHPVIHVVRDAAGIYECVQGLPEERIGELLLGSGSAMRACSNYEFYNLTEPTPEAWKRRAARSPGSEQQSSHQATGNGRTLLLKRVERDFHRFLRNIIGEDQRRAAHQSSYPLSQVALEQRNHTLAVRVSIDDVLSDDADIEGMQVGADCIELVCEIGDKQTLSAFNDISLAFAKVRRASILPILLHVKHRDRHVASNAVKQQIPDVTKLCLRLSPEFCAFDLSLPDALLKRLTAVKGNCVPIGVLELLDRPAQGWRDEICVERFRQAARLGCMSFRLTMPTTRVEDVFDVESFRHTAEALKLGTCLAAYSTGPQGMLSRSFNSFLTTVSPPLDVRGGLHGIDDQHESTANDVTEALFVNGILEPLKFFVFGADVSYSLSPAMHNAAYKACSLQYSYEARSSGDLEELKSAFGQPDFGGASVAQPFKTTLLPLVDGLSPHARVIGAINTVVPLRELNSDDSIPDDHAIITRRHRQGPVKALYGFNTDWIGIRACIRRGLSPANTVRIHSTAIVCGAGGMARSAVYSLLSLGVKNIVICNRTTERATALADHYNELIETGKVSGLDSDQSKPHIHVLPSISSSWPDDLRQPTMIISGVPRQEAGQPPVNFSLPDSWLKSSTGGIVLELAYRQGISTLAGQVSTKALQGWIFMDGIDMLPEQAFAQFELFTGRRAPRGTMKNEVLKHRPFEKS